MLLLLLYFPSLKRDQKRSETETEPPSSSHQPSHATHVVNLLSLLFFFYPSSTTCREHALQQDCDTQHGSSALRTATHHLSSRIEFSSILPRCLGLIDRPPFGLRDQLLTFENERLAAMFSPYHYHSSYRILFPRCQDGSSAY